MPADPLTSFDPLAVPPQPIIDVHIGLDRSGREYAQVDGIAVTSRPDETARQAAVRVVAELVDVVGGVDASGRRARAVRARVHGEHREPQMLMIHRERRLFVPSEGNDPTSAPHLIDGPLQGPSSVPRERRAATSGPASCGGSGAGAPSGATALLDRSSWSQTFLDDSGRDPVVTLSYAVPAAIAARTSTTAITVPAVPSRPVRAPDRVEGPASPGPAPRPGERTTSSGQAGSASTGSRRQGGGSGGAVRRGGPVVAVFVAAALVLAGVAWSVTLLRTPPSRPPAASGSNAAGTPVTFPAVAPAGWSSRARWSTGPVAADAGRVVTVGTDAVAYVTASGVLTVVDATSGAARWRADLAAGSGRAPAVLGGIGLTSIDGVEVIAVQTATTLRWWNRADGSGAGTVTLPAGARTTYLGDTALVGLNADTVAVVTGGALRSVTVPAGAFALAARVDSGGPVVSAASAAGWWQLRPGAPAAAATPWEDPGTEQDAPGVTPSVVGYVHSSFVLRYPPDRGGRAHVVVHTDRVGDVRVSFRAPLVPAAGRTRWFPSPSGTWAVLGRTLVDLRRGSVTDLGGWSTTWVTADTAYGSVGGQSAAVGPTTPRGVRAAAEATPEAVTSAGAAVRVRSSGAQTVYLLPPSG